VLPFNCPECGESLQPSEVNARKLVNCPTCGRKVDFPDSAVMSIQSSKEDARLASVVTSGKAKTSFFLGIMSLFCNVLTGLPALLLGILALFDIKSSRGHMTGRVWAIAGITSACIGTLLSCVALSLMQVKVKEAAARKQSENNLKLMGIALCNYHDMYGYLPAAGLGDPRQFSTPDQKPLLSWRVAILPFIDRMDLHDQFKLDEPWDGPNNIKLLSKMPKTYRLPTDEKTPPDHTHYQVFVGKGTAFEQGRKIGIRDFTNGASNTILIVEAAQAVPWTKPDDIPFNPDEPIAPLLSTFFRGTHVAMADGSARFFPLNTPDSAIKAFVKRDGN